MEATVLIRDDAMDPFASVDVDVDEFESDQRLFAIDSAAPVFALQPKSARARHSGRPLLVGLFALCLLLVAVALAGLLRSDIDQSRHNAAGETPPTTLVAPIGLSPETPAPVTSPAEVAPGLAAATAAASAATAPAERATAASAAPEPTHAAAKPAQQEPAAPPPIRSQDEQRVVSPAPPPAQPPVQKPAPSPSPQLPRFVVPNDTPKF